MASPTSWITKLWGSPSKTAILPSFNFTSRSVRSPYVGPSGPMKTGPKDDGQKIDLENLRGFGRLVVQRIYPKTDKKFV